MIISFIILAALIVIVNIVTTRSYDIEMYHNYKLWHYILMFLVQLSILAIIIFVLYILL